MAERLAGVHPALREHGDPAGRGGGRVVEGDAAAGRVDAQAVGADQADAAGVESLEHLALELGALLVAGFREAGREEVDDAHALGHAVVHEAQDRRGGHGGDDVVDLARRLNQRAVDRRAVGELAALRVDAVDVFEPVEVADAAQEGLSAAPADVGGGDAGDGHRAWGEGDAEGVLPVAFTGGHPVCRVAQGARLPLRAQVTKRSVAVSFGQLWSGRRRRRSP